MRLKRFCISALAAVLLITAASCGMGKQAESASAKTSIKLTRTKIAITE